MIPKFRAWDSLENKVRYDIGVIEFNGFDRQVNGLAFNYVLDDTGYNEVDNSQSEYYDANCFELMQSTGIKDKNGIEIYEGDVVKVNKRISNKRLIGVVEYCGAAFRVRGVKQYLGSEDELNRLYVVIGNKYEHPYLLEEDNHASD